MQMRNREQAPVNDRELADEIRRNLKLGDRAMDALGRGDARLVERDGELRFEVIR
jgi:hypothetical protein